MQIDIAYVRSIVDILQKISENFNAVNQIAWKWEEAKKSNSEKILKRVYWACA